jgi:hypothetical protein
VTLTWSVGSSLWIFPHSLSYFNELVGGPKGGAKHLLDSNIDWGQDLLYLKDWLDRHPDVKLDGLAYWGPFPATLVGIPEAPRPPVGWMLDEQSGSSNELEHQLGPMPGWYALSVNCIYDRSGQHRYFLNLQPAGMAGYSIYIYHITLEDANRVRRGLRLPELPGEYWIAEGS